ncbi:hypothetical protein [Leptotrichia hofstadii]|uniref:Uncharacterized protein n=1 Tax=Leptotrichia hofstadii F0254 TaxID=634994 RepID=C9MWD5_9FUSO|nr:hypothetical protein [Leptotrichia hofstadii]EEX74801.1 hypothetical protein GCWU000323_00856 [Leptotrichia hofstadii F0254]
MAEKNDAVLTVNEGKNLEKNQKNNSPKWDLEKKNLLVKILIVIGLILCIFGIMDKIFEHTIFNFLKFNNAIFGKNL